MTESFFHLKAELHCGAIIEFDQPERHMNMTITLTPPLGVPMSDIMQVKDDKLIIRSTVESMVGVYQIMKLMAGEQKKKKLFGIF